MTRKDRSRRPRLETLLTAIEVFDSVAGSSFRQAGAVLAMMATALVGCAVLGAVLGVTGVVILVLGVSQGPYAWLGTGILWVGVVAGFGGAALVMLRIVRRQPAVSTLAGFAETTNPATDPLPPTPSPIVRPETAMTAEHLLALDARLSQPPISPGATSDEPAEHGKPPH
jgi:hypothetical protein